ncbi:MAG: SNF2-related protein [Candidatus Thorarchaeota archaeon]
MLIDLKEKTLSVNDNKRNFKLRHKSQLYDWGFELVNNNYILISNNFEQILPKLLKYFTKSRFEFELSETCKILLDRRSKKVEDYQKLITIAEEFKDSNFDSIDYNQHIKFLGNHLIRKLKSHQIKASYHLYLLRSAANFSVPGSGKTTVVLSVYERLRSENKVNTLFVIGPPACFGPWKEEFGEVLGRYPSYKILAGGNKNERKLEYYRTENFHELYLSTFNTLFNDKTEIATLLNNSRIKPFLVIDEAHYIKQVSGNWAQAVLSISKYSDFKCILTGTPIPKSYTDLYNLFDFLWPDQQPISGEEKVKLKIFEEQKDYISAKNILEPSIGPLFYRVRKKELCLKPQIFLDPIKVPMNPYEKIIYDAIVKKIRNYAKEDYLKNIDLVLRLRRGRMIRLRQCLSNVHLLKTAIQDYNEDIIKDNRDLASIISDYNKIEIPAKIEYLLQLIKKFNQSGEKVVIWSHFIGSIKFIEKYLKSNGFNSKKIIGETPIERTSLEDEETREKIRNEFVDSDSGLDILLANPAACAESISLHKTCQNAIYYDLSYNCSQYLQSLDRIHRVGGSENKPAYYYYLQYIDTIDKDILENLNIKAQKMYDIIENDYSVYSLDMSDFSDELEAYVRLFINEKYQN